MQIRIHNKSIFTVTQPVNLLTDDTKFHQNCIYYTDIGIEHVGKNQANGDGHRDIGQKVDGLDQLPSPDHIKHENCHQKTTHNGQRHGNDHDFYCVENGLPEKRITGKYPDIVFQPHKIAIIQSYRRPVGKAYQK